MARIATIWVIFLPIITFPRVICARIWLAIELTILGILRCLCWGSEI
jgi:hypothetical protein